MRFMELRVMAQVWMSFTNNARRPKSLQLVIPQVSDFSKIALYFLLGRNANSRSEI